MPSANDNFANRETVSITGHGTYTGATIDTTGNTSESGEPNSGLAATRSAWYDFTPTTSGNLIVSTNASWVLGIHTGTAVNALTTVATQSSISANELTNGVPLTAGTSYKIQVGLSNNAALTPVFEFGAAPANDMWADAQDLNVTGYGLWSSTTVSGRFAGRESSEPNSGVSEHTLWYKFTAPTNGYINYRVDTGGETPRIASFTGPALASLTQLDSSTSSDNVWLESRRAVTAGTTYYIQVGNATTNAVLSIDYSAATWTHRIATGTTNNQTTYASSSFTPAEGDLLVVACGHSNFEATAATLTASANGITFTHIVQQVRAAVDTIHLFVADQLVPASPTSMTLTYSPGASCTGAVIWAASLKGITKTGTAAIRQSLNTNGAAGTTPGGSFASAAVASSSLAAFVFNGANPAGVTPPTDWAERMDSGWSTPTRGYEGATRNGGVTSSAVTYGATSATVWAILAAEFDTTSGTTVALGQATETDAAQPWTVVQPQTIALGQATEADTAQPWAVVQPQTIALGQATEADTANSIGPTNAQFVALAQATEADEAQPWTADNPQALALGQAAETDTAGTLTVGATGQLVALGQATEADTAGVITPHRSGSWTDTSNRVGGRLRDGLGVATWEPAVVAPPASTAAVLAYDVAHSFGPITRPNTTQPVYTVTTATTPRQRDRILVGGVDVTYFRGIPTPLPTYQLISPLLYGPATLVFPQIAASFEQLGVGDRKWLRKGAPVVIQRVNATTSAVEATDYKGLVVAFNVDGKNLTVEVGGQASGRAALVNRQPPLWHKVRDAGQYAWGAIRDLRLNFEPRMGPDTGIDLANWGAVSHLDYINELCAKAQDRDGTQWTLMPKANGAYAFTRKDTTTTHATIYLDDARNVANLRRDIAEEPNRIFVTGLNPQGRRVRGAIYPGLTQGEAPPYPYTNTATTFGQGTTDADTDTGDGVTVMVSRLWTTKYLDLEDVPGGYDNDARKAVRSLQEDAGLSVTGVMNLATWRALFDLTATGYSLLGAHIEPMAQRSAVRRWLRTSSGAKSSRNPSYDPAVVPVDLNVDVGVGFKANQIREWARAELAAEDNWVGTITLTTGAVVNGTHVPGNPLVEADVYRARALKPGMNVWCPQFMGGTLFHISAVSVDATAVTLTVDTRARDTMKAWAVIQRNRETRHNPARAWISQHRSSTMANDGVAEWDAAGGVIEDISAPGNEWTVFPVAAGQEGTIARLRVRTDPAAEYVLAVFGRQVTPEWLEAKVPAPLTEAGTKKWESERIRRRLDNRLLLYAAGTDEQPCGYFPGKKTNEDGEATSDRLTGRHEDDAGVSYRTFAEPVLYVAVYPDRDTVLEAGRIMWNQLETSA